MVEFRYFELSAGVATYEQFSLVQDHWFVVNAARLEDLEDLHPEEVEIMATADRLRANPELLAWLPRVRGLQLDHIGAHGGRLENAHSLLDTLQEYAVRLSD